MAEANNKDNVTTGKPKVGGSIFCAPLGSALPTDTEGELDTAFKNLGYISDDGLQNGNDMTNSEVKAWGGDTVANILTEKKDTFSLKLIEVLNPNVLKVVYGSGNVSGTLEAGITVKANSQELEEWCWVVDMIMKGDVLKRIVIPSAKVTEMETISYTDSDAVGYAVTLGATPDSAGNTHYEHIKKKAAE